MKLHTLVMNFHKDSTSCSVMEATVKHYHKNSWFNKTFTWAICQSSWAHMLKHLNLTLPGKHWCYLKGKLWIRPQIWRYYAAQISSENVPQTKMRHPVRLNPHLLHSPGLCSPVGKGGYRRREGYRREIQRGEKGKRGLRGWIREVMHVERVREKIQRVKERSKRWITKIISGM